MSASRFPAMLLICATILCTHVSSATAQTPSLAPSTVASPVLNGQAASPTGPRWDALPVGVQSQALAPQSVAPLAAPSMGRRQSTALIIVGGAAILVGAVIGGTPGTVFIVGGAVVGLYGLYEYLQ